MQVQQEDSEKQKIIDIPSPELLDFKVKAAEFKTFTKVMSYLHPQFFFSVFVWGQGWKNTFTSVKFPRLDVTCSKQNNKDIAL